MKLGWGECVEELKKAKIKIMEMVLSSLQITRPSENCIYHENGISL